MDDWVMVPMDQWMPPDTPIEGQVLVCYITIENYPPGWWKSEDDLNSNPFYSIPENPDPPEERTAGSASLV